MFGLGIILLLTVLGQFARLPILGGIMASDILVPVFASGWLLKKIFSAPTPSSTQALFRWPLILFFAIAGFSLLQSLLFLEPREIFDGLLYFVRLVSYGILAWIAYDAVRTEKNWKLLFHMMIIGGTLIAIAGFIQLKIYPDFKPMEIFGWDAHKGRLLSTWFDPNIVGGLFAFLLPLTISKFSLEKNIQKKWLLLASITAMFAALLLTFSRSSYLAFAVGLLIIGIFQARKILATVVLVAALFISFSPYARERTLQMAESGKAILTGTQTIDASSSFRVESWKNAVKLWKEHPFFGIGYNNFEVMQLREGMLQKPGLHHASGSDSTWLNILATTGIFGFLVFSFFYFREMHFAIRQKFGIGFFAAMAALLVHSQFVNSLFFPLFMPYLLISIALLEKLTIFQTVSKDTSHPQKQKNNAALRHSPASL